MGYDMYDSSDDSDMGMTEADIHLFYKNKEPEPEPTKEQQHKTAIFRKAIIPVQAEKLLSKDWELIENMNQEDLSNLYYSLNKNSAINNSKSKIKNQLNNHKRNIQNQQNTTEAFTTEMREWWKQRIYPFIRNP